MALSESGGWKPVEPVRALTAVRGLAAWWVVAYHFRDVLPSDAHPSLTWFLDQGYLAVDLFFVLSGFVIALNYGVRFERKLFNRDVYTGFLVLRLSRIYPLHLTILLLFAVNPLAITLFSTRGLTADLDLGYYGLSYLLIQAWGIIPGSGWNVPAWSISAEWLAYLLFPALAFSAFKLAGSPWRAILFSITVLSGLGVVTSMNSIGSLGSGVQIYGLLRCLSEFSAGIGLWHLGRGRQRRAFETPLSLLFATLCFWSFVLGREPDYIIMPAGFAALIYGLADERGSIARILRLRPLQYLGIMSYSTYMCHYLLKTWIKFIFVRPDTPSMLAFWLYLSAVLLASALLHPLVERPGQKWVRSTFMPAKP